VPFCIGRANSAQGVNLTDSGRKVVSAGRRVPLDGSAFRGRLSDL
jgi:hypothetical protein